MIFIFEYLMYQVIRYRIRYAYIRQVIIEVTVTVLIYSSTFSHFNYTHHLKCKRFYNKNCQDILGQVVVENTISFLNNSCVTF